MPRFVELDKTRSRKSLTLGAETKIVSEKRKYNTKESRKIFL